MRGVRPGDTGVPSEMEGYIKGEKARRIEWAQNHSYYYEGSLM